MSLKFKGQLDEEYLLKITSHENLSEIEELDLNKLGLSETDFIPDVFDKLTSLVELNLSGNHLAEIPSNIKIPKLQYLDMSNNCMKTIGWVERFSNLIELDIEDNVALTIDDSYKATFLLKHLQFIDGKRIDNREKFGDQYTQGLIVQMERLWNLLEFPKRLKGLTENVLLEEFLPKAKEKIRHGPSSLKEYRQWRIDHLGKEFVKYKLKCPEQSFLNNYVNSVETRKPLKHKSDSITDAPSSKAPKTVSSSVDLSYSAVAALQCHSKEAGAQDFSTQVWCCEFEPNKNNPSETTNIVATCGGESICLVDCETSKVQAKFHQPNEEFFTLTWTTVTLGKKPSNILAAGGCLGFIHLIHPDQDICYGRIKTHSAPIQSMIFSPTGATHLISADRKSKIFLIDIDVPTTPEYKFSWKKLVVFGGIQQATPLKLLVPDSGFYLLCATELGLYCWETNGFMKNRNRTVTSVCELTFPYVDPHTRIVDALSMVAPGWIVSKSAQQGVIFLWDFNSLKSEVSKAIQNKKQTVAVKIGSELKWSNTKQCYINIACCPKLKQIVSGDEKGNLWLYDIKTLVQSKKSSTKCPVPESVTNPVNIIPFPTCTGNSSKLSELRNGTIFNDVCMSSDGKYIVAAADSNLVVVCLKN